MELGPGEVWVVSRDSEWFKTERTVIAQHSRLFKNLMSDFPNTTVLAIRNVNGTVLAKIFASFKKPANEEAEAAGKEVCEWDAGCLEVDQSMLFELESAEKYIGTKGLADLMRSYITDMIEGKTPQQILEQLAKMSHLTEEEEAELGRKNAWGFE